MTEYSRRIIDCIKAIPRGRVATYGQIALAAGNIRGARQVARILHSCSSKYALPWHRVLSSGGRISLPEGGGREEQIALLASEGVVLASQGRVDLSRYLWDEISRDR